MQTTKMNATGSPTRLRIAVAGFHLIGLGFVALGWSVRRLPPTITAIPTPDSAEAAWWGVWPITYLSTWAFAFGVAAILGIVSAFWIREWKRGDLLWRTEHDAAPTSAAEQRQQAVLVSVSAVLLLAFFLFPIAHTRWGDAFLIARSMAWPDAELRLVFSWQAPLDVFLHSQIWAILQSPLGLAWKDASPIYRLLSPIAGALYLAVVLALSRRRTLAPGWLTYGLLTSLGLIQLFFGYVENYSFAAMGVLATLWLGLDVLAGRRSLWLAVLALAVTIAAHPSTAVLLPSLFYLAWVCYRRRNQSILAVVLQVALPMLAIGMGTLLLMEIGGHGIALLLTEDRPGGSDARWFVPLFEAATRWERYTIFSWRHLRDLLNEQWLVALVVLPSLLWSGLLLLAGLRKRNPLKDAASELTFLLIATVMYWLFIWTWNPDYGGQRDWDLFSLAALPSTLLLIALLPKVLPRRRYLTSAGLLLIAVQTMFTLAWIYQNTLPWEWPE